MDHSWWRLRPLGVALAVSFSLSLSLAFSLAAGAQELPQGGFELETETENSSGLWAWLADRAGGRIGTVMTEGDVVTRQLAALQLNLTVPTRWNVQSVLAVDFVDFDNRFEQEARDEASQRGLPPTREVLVGDSFTEVREAYVDWNFSDFAALRLGRQPLVWGQFEFLTPVGFMLPYRGTNTSTRPSRADFTYAQDAATLSLYPVSRLEVQLIHVPQMRIDPSIEENFLTFSRLFPDNVYSDGHAANRRFPDASDYDLSVLRAVWYGNRVTLGVTALDGGNLLLEPERLRHLTRDNCPPGESICWRDDAGLTYAEGNAFGIELSVQLRDGWTFRAEYAEISTLEDISYRPCVNEGVFCADGRALADFIIDENRGRAWYEERQPLSAIGFSYDGDDWFGYGQLANFEIEPKSANDRRLAELERIDERRIDDDADGLVPLFFVARRLGDDRQGFMGFGGTAFFSAYSVGFLGGWQFRESLDVGGFIGAVADVAGSPDGDELYESVDDGDAVVQFGITYLF